MPYPPRRSRRRSQSSAPSPKFSGSVYGTANERCDLGGERLDRLHAVDDGDARLVLGVLCSPSSAMTGSPHGGGLERGELRVELTRGHVVPLPLREALLKHRAGHVEQGEDSAGGERAQPRAVGAGSARCRP